jgi:mRNA-degrading endonuclease RelE of RelBE toxin-antitoxin system
MAYIPRSSPLYEKNFKRLTKKNAVLKERTLKKIREILDNPEIGVTLTQNLAGYCSCHVRNWVIIYKIVTQGQPLYPSSLALVMAASASVVLPSALRTMPLLFHATASLGFSSKALSSAFKASLYLPWL